MSAPLDPDSQDQLPRWFGDYVLLKKIGRGGMGQVYLARLPGLAGIDRLCVIKTLRSQWTNDREYVARFVDEARVVVQLNHRNICPVFDVGQVGRTYYLAMDLVHGRDLQAVLDRVRGLQVPLPIDLSLFIVGEVLEALDAAHRLRDPETDAPLNLVHRDVSPHNVLVSFDGEVKLIDFGLAQSELKQERTEPGVVLGKMAYMAPEHARGDVVDLRADVFAAGVMLYEMAVGERYWHGKSVAEIWQMVGQGAHRPSRLVDLPEPVQHVIEKATAPSLKDRYRSGADMKAAITRVQIARGVVAGSADLREQMDHLFGDEAGADRRERAALLKLPAPGTVVEGASGSTRIARAPGPPSSSASSAPAASEPPPTMTVSTSIARPSSSTPAAPVVPVVPPVPGAARAMPSLQVQSSSPLVSVTDEIRVVRPTEDQIPTDVGIRRPPSPSPSTSPTTVVGLDPPAPAAPSRSPLVLGALVVVVVAAIGLWSALGGPVSPPPAPPSVVVAAPPMVAPPPVPVAAPPVVAPPSVPEATPPVAPPSPAPVTPPPVVAPAVVSAPPPPPAPQPVVKAKPPAPAPSPAPAPAPAPVVVAWPSSLPRQPEARLDLLKRNCPRLACTKTLAAAGPPQAMTMDQLASHQGALVACLETCRQQSP